MSELVIGPTIIEDIELSDGSKFFSLSNVLLEKSDDGSLISKISKRINVRICKEVLESEDYSDWVTMYDPKDFKPYTRYFKQVFLNTLT
jgi:hypothetical protein